MVELDTIKRLVDNLFFDYDRLSSSGQETLNKLSDLLGIEYPTDKELLAMGLPKEELAMAHKIIKARKENK